MKRNAHFEGHQRATSLATGTALRVSDCRDCGEAIAWAKSKNDKWYPCNVYPKVDLEYGSNREVLRAAPWDVHRCKKEENV